MAEFVDSIDNEAVQQDEFQAEEAKQQQEQVAEESPAIPEKYKGKSMDEIIKMHQEAEKLIGRQAQEVGEVRKLADELIKRQITPAKQAAPAAVEDDVDFFADPVKAVNKAVAQHPAVQQAQVAAAQVARMNTANRLAQTHPDYTQVVTDPEFAGWVNESPVRRQLFAAADQQFDFDSAHELLTNFKALKKVRQEAVKQAAEQMQEENTKQLKAATVSAPSSTGETSNKIYRRAELIRLQLTDPERYMANQDDIMRAYAEGRVR